MIEEAPPPVSDAPSPDGPPTQRLKAWEWAIGLVILLIALLAVFWLVLHEVLDLIDATTGILGALSLTGLVLFVGAWALLLEHLGVIDLEGRGRGDTLLEVLRRK